MPKKITDQNPRFITDPAGESAKEQAEDAKPAKADKPRGAGEGETVKLFPNPRIWPHTRVRIGQTVFTREGTNVEAGEVDGFIAHKDTNGNQLVITA